MLLYNTHAGFVTEALIDVTLKGTHHTKLSRMSDKGHIHSATAADAAVIVKTT
jgi:hypothetical protein